MRLGIIGTGKMGQALVKGIKGSSAISADIFAYDIDYGSLRMAEKLGAQVCDSIEKVIKASDMIILAVKPQVLTSVLKQVSTAVHSNQVLISIAAGVTIDSISNAVNGTSKIVRVMPNTPALIGSGISAICVGEGLSDDEKQAVCSVFESVGEVVLLSEHLLDAVTGLSGSGPAYVYLIIEALSDAGVDAGLSREDARKLATCTLIGAARMVSETGLHPAELKDMVTSPAGTTIAGLRVLERGALRGLLMDAVNAAVKRCKDLRQGK
jgi:pyrroline-5-carboxylate reductase